MGNFSKIEHDFWQDDYVLNLTPEERYFYLYLLSNGRTNALGCYELRMKMAEVETGYNADTIKKYLNKFIATGKILFDFDTQEALIVNWHKYNWTKKTGNVNSILKDFKAIKSPIFRETLEGLMITSGIKKVCGEADKMETTGNNEEQQETEREICAVDIDTDIDFKKDMAEAGEVEPKEKLSSDQERFDQFWKIYPNKKAKNAALRRWKTMKISAETFQAIMGGLQRALVSKEWAKDGGAYIPHPATWLNGGCWEDDYKPMGTTTKRPDTPKDSAVDRRRQMMGLGDKNG